MNKKKQSYEQASKRLRELSDEIENQKIPLEKLPDALKEAGELLSYCRRILHGLEEEIEKNYPEKS